MVQWGCEVFSQTEALILKRKLSNFRSACALVCDLLAASPRTERTHSSLFICLVVSSLKDWMSQQRCRRCRRCSDVCFSPQAEVTCSNEEFLGGRIALILHRRLTTYCLSAAPVWSDGCTAILWQSQCAEYLHISSSVEEEAGCGLKKKRRQVVF